MNKTIYIQTGKSVKVQNPVVKIKDVARISCSDKRIQNQCENMAVMNLKELPPGPYTILAIDLLGKISNQIKEVELVHMGEVGIVINYEPKITSPGILDYLKTAFVCMILFFGAGFSIMTFNTDVDTRELVRLIRDNGNMKAMLTFEENSLESDLASIKNYNEEKDIISIVSCKKTWYARTANPTHTIVIVDLGVKHSVVKKFNEEGLNVIIVPYNVTMDQIKKLKPQGVVISNGPGNPNNYRW